MTEDDARVMIRLGMVDCVYTYADTQSFHEKFPTQCARRATQLAYGVALCSEHQETIAAKMKGGARWPPDDIFLYATTASAGVAARIVKQAV